LVGMIGEKLNIYRRCSDIRSAKIHLSEGKIDIEKVSALGPSVLGGRGLNHWFLLKELPRGTLPLSSDNIIAFGTGLLVGTDAPGAVRTNVASKNSLGGGIGSSSAGGDFSRTMRLAGIDHLLLFGRAKEPVYVLLDDGKIEIKSAKHLWGKTTKETIAHLEGELGEEAKVACIGPAGEKLSLTACILFTSGRAVGRGGLGAVLGSKNVKAIVVKGTGSISVDNNVGFRQAVEAATEKVTSSELLQLLQVHGTVAYGAVEMAPTRVSPARNYQRAEPAYRPHLDDYKQYSAGSNGPKGCPTKCGQAYKIENGEYAGTYVEKCEGNSLEDFGFRLDISDPAAVIKAHELCQLYGLDVDKASGVIAWAFECYQRSILTKADTDGLELEWGNENVVIALIEKIGTRSGFGDILADGCRQASLRIGKGSERYCIQIKGEELEEAIRPYKGWALGVIVSERAGGHTRGAPLTEFGDIPGELAQEIWGIENASAPTSYEGKAKLVAYYERFHAVLDSLGMCYFMSNWMEPSLLGPDDLAVLVSAATGWKMSSDSLMQVGERIHTLGRIFNQIHAGFDRENDYPPDRLMTEPVDAGPFTGERLDREPWDKMLDEYYSLHKWDVETGRVTNEALTKNGLDELQGLLEVD